MDDTVCVPPPHRLMRLSRTFFRLGVGLAAASLLSEAHADKRVVVTSTANSKYIARKFVEGKPVTETYVFMQGHYFEGFTVDQSIDKMPFRRIAEYLAPELAKQQYLPAMEPKQADLLLVIHWGTTVRHVTTQEMTGNTSIRTDTSTSASTLTRQVVLSEMDPNSIDGQSTLAQTWLGDERNQASFDILEQMTEQTGSEMTKSSNVALLGYGRHLARNSNQPWSTETERTLRSDLATERYFIIVKAYDLKEKIEPGRNRRAVWTLHMNMSSAGNNFRTALASMSQIAASYFGQATDSVKTITPRVRKGEVVLAPLIILGESN